MCGKYDHSHHGGGCWDDLATHANLIDRLSAEFPDGWALSLHVPSLRQILPLCPDDVRVCSWVKPFASFKKNVRRAWTWEPVIVRGGRPLPDGAETVRDYVAAGITLQRGFGGAKPDKFCRWLFAFLGMEPDDEFVDLFPGSGAVTRAHEAWRNQYALNLSAPSATEE
jgi:hypothetical protein